MSLGKRKSGNDFLPALKYDARVGQMILQDRVFVDGQWAPEQRVVTDNFRAVFDLENLQRGWIEFPKGGAPKTVLVPAGVDPGDPPSDEHKEGLRIVVKMDDVLGGDVRELMSTAVTLWNAVDDLHDKYLAGVDDHPGELPVVTLTGTRERKTQRRHKLCADLCDRGLGAAAGRASGCGDTDRPAKEGKHSGKASGAITTGGGERRLQRRNTVLRSDSARPRTSIRPARPAHFSVQAAG